jgi:hypothetical protein
VNENRRCCGRENGTTDGIAVRRPATPAQRSTGGAASDSDAAGPPRSSASVVRHVTPWRGAPDGGALAASIRRRDSQTGGR